MTLSAILPRPAFRAALATVARAVEKRNSIPVLSNVRLASVGGQIILTGTDMDVTISATIAESCGDDGFDITLPAHKLLDLEKRAPLSPMVALDMPALIDTENVDGQSFKTPDGDSTRLDFDGLRVQMQHIGASDFPDMAFSGPIHADFTLATADLVAMLDRVAFAISTEETRYYLNGIYMHALDRGNRRLLRFVATDGHRLSSHDLDAPEGVTDPETGKLFAGTILPRKTCDLLRKIAGAKGAEETIRVHVNTNKVRFTLGNIEIVTKIVDGTFPDYERVIPSRNDKIASFESKALAAAIDMVSCISSEKGRAVKFSLAPGLLTLLVSNPDLGVATTTIPAEYDGPEIEIGFNSRYMQEIITALDSERIMVSLEDNGAPALIANPDDDSTRCVLMPIRI